MMRVKTVTVDRGRSPSTGDKDDIVVSMYRSGQMLTTGIGPDVYTVIAYDPSDMEAMAHYPNLQTRKDADARFDRLVKMFTIGVK